ncbi:MAG: hypothetical protein ACYCVB_09785 [Bacilli bacterium]
MSYKNHRRAWIAASVVTVSALAVLGTRGVPTVSPAANGSAPMSTSAAKRIAQPQPARNQVAKRASTSATRRHGPLKATYGWRYVNLKQTFLRNVRFQAFAVAPHALRVTVMRYEQSGNELLPTYETALLSLPAGTFSDIAPASHPYVPPHGPIHLVWPASFPTHFQTQSVKIEQGGKPIATWPKVIPLYGSASNPQTAAAPGHLDNRILGQTGNWLWVALKGPHTPPRYPLSKFWLFGFRYWNRLVALNVKTAQYRLYAIPRSTSYAYDSLGWNAHPVFTSTKGMVYVGIGSWVGTFPANPEKFAQVPILSRPSAQLVQARARLMIASLTELEWQEINSLAAYWDHLKGARVPGMAQYLNGYVPWNAQSVIFNHGDLPSQLVWAFDFPLAHDSSLFHERNTIETETLTLLNSSLNGYQWTPVITTHAQVLKYFHNRPPYPLPGYTIRDGAYWPVTPGVLTRGVPPFPDGFTTYGQVFRAVTSWLAQRAPLYQLFPFPSSALKFPAHKWLDVQNRLLPDGYTISVSAGLKLRANSPKIIAGNANLLFSMAAVQSGHPLPVTWKRNPNVAIVGTRPTRVSLGRGIDGLLYAGRIRGVAERSLAWTQYGIHWGIAPTSANVNLIAAAEPLVASIAREDSGLSGSGLSGSGIFSYGSGTPSQLTLSNKDGTYAFYAPGWRAPSIVAELYPLYP